MRAASTVYNIQRSLLYVRLSCRRSMSVEHKRLLKTTDNNLLQLKNKKVTEQSPSCRPQ